jgi:hypothetical protein
MPGIFGLWGDSLDHLVHLLVAFVLALPIGWHRAREEQSAGLRTFPLVATASCGPVQTAISVIGASVPFNANILSAWSPASVSSVPVQSSGKAISRRVTLRPPVFGQSASWARQSAMATTTSGSF